LIRRDYKFYLVLLEHLVISTVVYNHNEILNTIDPLSLMMTSEQDKNSGKFILKFPDEKFIVAIKQKEVISTREVSDFVGCSFNLALVRLKKLREKGIINGRLVGNSHVWWASRK